VTTSHAANDVFATSSAAGTIESRKPIVELDLPSGKYAILGKINIDQDNDAAYVTVVCTLSQGGIPLDVNVITLQPSSISFLDNGTIPFQAVRDLRGTTQSASLVHFLPCQDRSVPWGEPNALIWLRQDHRDQGSGDPLRASESSGLPGPASGPIGGHHADR
jgi:hypothetical protein